jgi:hypothetical protein
MLLKVTVVAPLVGLIVAIDSNELGLAGVTELDADDTADAIP